MSTWSDSIYEEAEFLRKSLSTFGLLVFRRQSINEAELIAFSSIFGELGIILRSDWASSINPEITRITNLRDAKTCRLVVLVRVSWTGTRISHTCKSLRPVRFFTRLKLHKTDQKRIGRTSPSRMRAFPIQQNESSKVKEVYLVMQNA